MKSDVRMGTCILCQVPKIYPEECKNCPYGEREVREEKGYIRSLDMNIAR